MQLLCHTNDLEITGAKSLTIKFNDREIDIFVIKNETGIFGYLDVCPHAGTPLEWQADRFFEETGTYIMCATHGAQFEVHNGLCVNGPCVGESLTRLPLKIENEKIYLNAEQKAAKN